MCERVCVCVCNILLFGSPGPIQLSNFFHGLLKLHTQTDLCIGRTGQSSKVRAQQFHYHFCTFISVILLAQHVHLVQQEHHRCALKRCTRPQDMRKWVVTHTCNQYPWSASYSTEVCFCAKIGTFWKPFSTHFDMPSLATLAETALLFYRVTDVPFLPKMDQ